MSKVIHNIEEQVDTLASAESQNGILLVDKSEGPSSAKVISKIKRSLSLTVKIGHAGTLDPFASGLLVVLVGKATRLADYFQSGDKVYSGEIQLGLTTDSDDITGKILSENNQSYSFEKLNELAHSIIGTFNQVPPKVSAIHIDGKRAYKLARNGEDFEINPRSVTLSSIELKELEQKRIFFRIHCSKGFYVRALARDLGNMLGTGACLKSLRRESSLPFRVDEAIDADKVSLDHLIAWENAMKLKGNQELEVEDQEFSSLKNGLIPYTLQRSAALKLDSSAKDLLVYKRKSDGKAGGLISACGPELKIVLNM